MVPRKLYPQINVAIADDHPALVKGLEHIINANENYRVTIVASNGEMLIDRINASKIKPTVCIVDWSMPILDGLETLKIINQRWPSIKVVMMSIFYNELVVIRALKAGASSYLPKGASSKEIHNAIRDVNDKDFYHTELTTKCLKYIIQGSSPLVTLSEKEILFLQYCCTEMSYADIGKAMNVGHRTIDGYRDCLFEKLNVHTRIALAIFAFRAGLVPL